MRPTAFSAFMGAACVLLMASPVRAVTYQMHGLAGRLVPLEVADSVVAVQFDRALTSAEAALFAVDRPELTDDYEPRSLGERFQVFAQDAALNIDTVIARLRQAPQVTMVNPVFVWRGGNQYMTDVAIVGFSPFATAAQVDSLHVLFGSTVLHTDDRNPLVHFVRVDGRGGRSALDVANAYFESGLCEYAEPNFIFGALPLGTHNPDTTNPPDPPADPLFPKQWHLLNDGLNGYRVDADIDADLAWEISKGNSAVTVAIIDWGFLGHEDWDTTTPIDGWDVVGTDVTDPVEDDNPAPGCVSDIPFCWHGTAILGELAAGLGNHIGVSGLAPRCSYYCVKAFEDFMPWETTPTLLVKALRKAWLPPVSAKIISCSWGAPYSAYLEAELWTMNANGVAAFFAAGNSGVVEFPASADSVYAVGATNDADFVTTWSGKGPKLDLVAPGEYIWTWDIIHELGYSRRPSDCDSNWSYNCEISGTSFAAPLVAGTAALVLSRRPDFIQRYGNSLDSVLFEILRNSAEDKGPPGRDDSYGWGRINAYRALLSVSESYSAVLTANPQCEYHAKRGQVNTETLTISNQGAGSLNGTISKVLGASWLTLTTGGAYTINPGDPDKVVTVTMSGVGIMTEGLYQDTIRVTHNAPNLPSPQNYPIDFFVIDDFYCPQTENLKTGMATTGSLALDVRSDGRFASQQVAGGLWRFRDSSSSIFDGSLLVAHGSQPVGDTVVYHRFYNRSDSGQFGFRAVGNLKIDTAKYGTNHGYAKACARLATKDSAVGVAVEWIFPQNSDSDEFVLARYTFFSNFGPMTITSPTVENVVAGVLADLDVTPASRYGLVQSGVENQNGGDPTRGLIWQQGADTAGHVPSPPSYTAERYRGGIEYIGPGTLIGARVGNSGQDIQPGGGPKSEFLYRTLVTLSGISTPALPDTDMHAIMTLAKGKQLGNPHKALQVVVALVSDTINENSFKATADKARAYATAIGLVSGPTNFCFGDPQCDGVSSVQDIVKMVDVGMRGFAAVFDPGFRFERTDVDCSGFTTIQDVVKVVNVAFRGGTVQANFCFPLCP